MSERDAMEIPCNALGGIDLQAVQRALIASGQHQAFLTYTHQEQFAQIVGSLQPFQSAFQQIGLKP